MHVRASMRDPCLVSGAAAQDTKLWLHFLYDPALVPMLPLATPPCTTVRGVKRKISACAGVRRRPQYAVAQSQCHQCFPGQCPAL